MVHNRNIKQVHYSFGGLGHLGVEPLAAFVQVLDIYVDTFESVSDFPSILTEKDEARPVRRGVRRLRLLG